MSAAVISKEKIAISDQTKITLFFALSLTSGEIIDSNFDKIPAKFTFGDGSLLPAFEAVLLGMSAGEQKQWQISAAEAFGLRQEANMKRISRTRFAPDMELVPGLVVNFSAREGGELSGVVSRLMGDMVEIDFNHPLAGHDIVFDVAIVAVEEV